MGKRRYRYDTQYRLENFLNQGEMDYPLVLPHFQRNFVWDAKKRQKSLLKSMLAGIPIGSVLLLEDNKDAYASRPLCSIKFEAKIEGDTCTFLLDGQQRISTLKSMFYDLSSSDEIEKSQKSPQDLWNNVPLKLRNRWFLKIVLDGEDEDDIWGINDLDFKETYGGGKSFGPDDFDKYIDYKSLKEVTSRKNQLEDHTTNTTSSEKLVPLYYLGTDIEIFNVMLKRIAEDKHKGEDLKIKTWVTKVTKFLRKNTLETIIPSIILNSRPGMEVGIYIFEQVNKAGVKLDIYDLLVANVARKSINLTEKIQELCETNFPSVNGNNFDAIDVGIWNAKENIPENIFKRAFKNCLAICNLKNKNKLESLSDKYIKEEHILNLSTEEIYKSWEETVITLFSVVNFLHSRCGLVRLNDISYELLVVPLFVFFITHKNKPTDKDISKIEYWYWASIFCGSYNYNPASSAIKDSIIIINNKNFHEEFSDRFDNIFNEKGYSDRDSLMIERSGLDKAIVQYVLSKRPSDLYVPSSDSKLEVRELSACLFSCEKEPNLKNNLHHIIPLNVIAKQDNMTLEKLKKKKEHPVNSALNKVITTKNANLKIQRLDDYNEMELSCARNLIPRPSDFMDENKHCKLDEFLFARFEKIKIDVQSHLQKLNSKASIK